jgi:hypothetical protein
MNPISETPRDPAAGCEQRTFLTRQMWRDQDRRSRVADTCTKLERSARTAPTAEPKGALSSCYSPSPTYFVDTSEIKLTRDTPRDTSVAFRVEAAGLQSSLLPQGLRDFSAWRAAGHVTTHDSDGEAVDVQRHVPAASRWSRFVSCSIVAATCPPDVLHCTNESRRPVVDRSAPQLDILHRTTERQTGHQRISESRFALRLAVPRRLLSTPFLSEDSRLRLLTGVGASLRSPDGVFDVDGVMVGVSGASHRAGEQLRLAGGYQLLLSAETPTRPAMPSPVTLPTLNFLVHGTAEWIASWRLNLLFRLRGRLVLQTQRGDRPDSCRERRAAPSLLQSFIDGSADSGRGMPAGDETMQHSVRGVRHDRPFSDQGWAMLRIEGDETRGADLRCLCGVAAGSLEVERLSWRYAWCRPMTFVNASAVFAAHAAGSQLSTWNSSQVSAGFGVVRVAPQSSSNVFNNIVPQRVECSFNWLRLWRAVSPGETEQKPQWLHRDPAHPDRTPILLPQNSLTFFPFKCGTVWEF